MQFHTLPLGPLQTNCYILPGEKGRCLVVDPGDEAAKILRFLEGKGLTLDSVLLTHGHFDHVGAVRQLAADTDCRVFLHEKELTLPSAMTDGPLYYTDLYPAEGSLRLAGLEIKVIPTPGHTPGGVCLLLGDALFSGDTLFAGSMGRCDFPGSNIYDMRKSLKKLWALPGDYRVFPGHAEDTTLEQERKTNPYLR